METNYKEKKAILVISFGTSTCKKNIELIENDIKTAYPEYTVRRAFSSQIIINKLKKEENIKVDNINDAMTKLINENFKTVICQPTHIINGYEYDKIISTVNKYKNKIHNIQFGKPLLSSSEDYEKIVKAVKSEFSQLKQKDILIMVGHGTQHFSDASYAALDYRFKAMGAENIFLGTVEGYPNMQTVLDKIKKLNPQNIYLTPFMIVAGEHAENDIGGDSEGTWKTELKKLGYSVVPVIKGIGEYKSIRDIFLEHIKDANI